MAIIQPFVTDILIYEDPAVSCVDGNSIIATQSDEGYINGYAFHRSIINNTPIDYSGGATDAAHAARWSFVMNDKPDVVSHIGADLEFRAFDNYGHPIGTMISLSRSLDVNPIPDQYTPMMKVNAHLTVYNEHNGPFNGDGKIEIVSDAHGGATVQFQRTNSGHVEDRTMRWRLGMADLIDFDQYHGADFVLHAYSNDGGYTGQPIVVDRSDPAHPGVYHPTATINGNLVVQNHQSDNQAYVDQSYFALKSKVNRQNVINFRKYLSISPNDDFSRWSIYCGDGPENGSDSGSDFGITRYDDAGHPLSNPFEIHRDSGLVKINDLLKLPVRSLASIPQNFVEDGMCFIDDTDNTIKFHVNGAWHTLTP